MEVSGVSRVAFKRLQWIWQWWRGERKCVCVKHLRERQYWICARIETRRMLPNWSFNVFSFRSYSRNRDRSREKWVDLNCLVPAPRLGWKINLLRKCEEPGEVEAGGWEGSSEALISLKGSCKYYLPRGRKSYQSLRTFSNSPLGWQWLRETCYCPPQLRSPLPVSFHLPLPLPPPPLTPRRHFAAERIPGPTSTEILIAIFDPLRRERTYPITIRVCISRKNRDSIARQKVYQGDLARRAIVSPPLSSKATKDVINHLELILRRKDVFRFNLHCY